MLAFEYIVETSKEVLACPGVGETGQRVASIIAHDAQVIDAVAMICVVVRPEDRIDFLNSIGQQLGSQIGRGVDEDTLPGVVLDYDRYTATAVSRLRWVAFAPVIPDTRNAGGRS